MIDLDSASLEIQCPECSFYSQIKYRDARLRDVIICRGCKTNIQLDDHMNECRKARKAMATALSDFQSALADISKNLQIKL